LIDRYRALFRVYRDNLTINHGILFEIPAYIVLQNMDESPALDGALRGILF
jgi:hypothetical protein